MAKLDLEWLGVFVEVYRTGSVSRAADHLGLAQASASIALGKLRRHYGDRLFTRSSLGMVPTPRAQQIYPELQEALWHLARAGGAPQAFDPQHSSREFRVCMTDISEIVLLPPLINHLRHTAPGVGVQAEAIGPQARRRLEAGEVDLAVGFMPDLEAGFYQQALFTQDFVCLAAADHPRIRGPIDRRAFCAEGHIIVSTSGTGHAIVDKVLARHRIARRTVLRVPSYLGVARIVAQTELLVIVPQRLGQAVAAHERVQMLAPPVPLPPFQVKLHWHERFHADPGNLWLRRTMAQLFGGAGAAAAVGAAPAVPA